jgi:hypothetical protein
VTPRFFPRLLQTDAALRLSPEGVVRLGGIVAQRVKRLKAVKLAVMDDPLARQRAIVDARAS